MLVRENEIDYDNLGAGMDDTVETNVDDNQLDSNVHEKKRKSGYDRDMSKKPKTVSFSPVEVSADEEVKVPADQKDKDTEKMKKFEFNFGKPDEEPIYKPYDYKPTTSVAIFNEELEFPAGQKVNNAPQKVSSKNNTKFYFGSGGTNLRPKYDASLSEYKSCMSEYENYMSTPLYENNVTITQLDDYVTPAIDTGKSGLIQPSLVDESSGDESSEDDESEHKTFYDCMDTIMLTTNGKENDTSIEFATWYWNYAMKNDTGGGKSSMDSYNSNKVKNQCQSMLARSHAKDYYEKKSRRECKDIFRTTTRVTICGIFIFAISAFSQPMITNMQSYYF